MFLFYFVIIIHEDVNFMFYFFILLPIMSFLMYFELNNNYNKFHTDRYLWISQFVVYIIFQYNSNDFVMLLMTKIA